MLVPRSSSRLSVPVLLALGALAWERPLAHAAPSETATPRAGAQDVPDDARRVERDWRIVDGVGEPLAGVRVHASWQVAGEDPRDVELVSDGDGRLRFPEGDAGPPDGARLRRLEPAPPLARVALHGTRLDGPLGERVVLVAEPLAEVRVRVPGVRSLGVALLRSATDMTPADHRFHLPLPVALASVDGDEVRIPVPAGVHDVLLRIDGSLHVGWSRGTEPAPVLVEPGATLRLELPVPDWTSGEFLVKGYEPEDGSMRLVTPFVAGRGARQPPVVDGSESLRVPLVVPAPAGGFGYQMWWFLCELHGGRTPRSAMCQPTRDPGDGSVVGVGVYPSDARVAAHELRWGDLEPDRVTVSPVGLGPEEAILWRASDGVPGVDLTRNWVHSVRAEWGGDRELERIGWMGRPQGGTLLLTEGLEWRRLELEVPSDVPWLLSGEDTALTFDVHQVLEPRSGRVEARVLTLLDGTGETHLEPAGSRVGEAVVGRWPVTRMLGRDLVASFDPVVVQRVRCRGAVHGRAVPFAPVRVHLEGHGMRRFVADARGELRVVRPPGPTCWLAPGSGIHGWSLQLPASATDPDEPLVLHVPERGNRVTLQARDGFGAAMAYARLVPRGEGNGRSLLFDGSGRALLRGVVPGEYDVLVPLDRPDANVEDARCFPIVVPDGKRVTVDVPWP